MILFVFSACSVFGHRRAGSHGNPFVFFGNQGNVVQHHAPGETCYLDALLAHFYVSLTNPDKTCMIGDLCVKECSACAQSFGRTNLDSFPCGRFDDVPRPLKLCLLGKLAFAFVLQLISFCLHWCLIALSLFFLNIHCRTACWTDY